MIAFESSCGGRFLQLLLLLVLLMMFPHAKAEQGEVDAPGLQRSMSGTPVTSGNGTEPVDSSSRQTVSAEPVAEVPVEMGGREDLTAFFSIGIVVDILLVTAFLVWAVGQWRRTKK